MIAIKTIATTALIAAGLVMAPAAYASEGSKAEAKHKVHHHHHHHKHHAAKKAA